MEIKDVPLKEIHIGLGAKLVPFAGFNMPVRYSSDLEEHLCVRNNVGVFDVSHMGEFVLKGPKALDLIQYVSANDASVLIDGKIQYSYLPNEEGGVVDDLLVYKIKDDEYFLVVNASNIQKDWDWISSHNSFGVEMEDVSDQTSLFAVQGPNALAVLQKLCSFDLASLDYYSFVSITFAGVPNVKISATGYTGAGGFEIYVHNKDAEQLWNIVFEAGASFGILPIGLGARDTLRLEMGYCLYGNDLNDTWSPLEAGLGWVTKFSKKFVNSTNLEIQKKDGLKRKMIGLEMLDRGIPRSHYPVCDANGQQIGEVSSGTQSPCLQKGIALAYVNIEHSKVGTEVYISIREKLMKAIIVKTPFVKPNVS